MRSQPWPPIAWCALLGLWATEGIAQELKIEKGDCKTGVRLVARDVPVSQVLAQLSKELGFQLKFKGDTDRIVNVDMTRRSPELIAKLLESESIIFEETPDPQCPGTQRVAKVWVLPKGEEGPPRPRELTPMEMYRKAHGMPLEDEPQKPAAGEKAP